MKRNRPYLFRPKRWAIWMVLKDIKNYRAWIRTINKEKENPRSLWYKFRMNHNFFYTIYFHLSLPQEDATLPDNIKRMRVVESLAPVHRYIDEDLEFAEYIVPEFNQFFDDENQPTLAYGIIYRFAFKRLSLGWVINRSIFITVIIWVLIKYSIISIFVEWLTNLI